MPASCRAARDIWWKSLLAGTAYCSFAPTRFRSPQMPLRGSPTTPSPATCSGAGTPWPERRAPFSGPSSERSRITRPSWTWRELSSVLLGTRSPWGSPSVGSSPPAPCSSSRTGCPGHCRWVPTSPVPSPTTTESWTWPLSSRPCSPGSQNCASSASPMRSPTSCWPRTSCGRHRATPQGEPGSHWPRQWATSPDGTTPPPPSGPP